MAKIRRNSDEIAVKDGADITDACEALGVPIVCRVGTCLACRIKIIEGEENLSELTDAEKAAGMDRYNRLACQCRLTKGEIKIKF